MATENRIDDNFADCKVYDLSRWSNGRYQHHKKNGYVVVEVVTQWAKTRRTFRPERVKLNDNVKMVIK